jgi:uncharacterized membrane protein (DUF373 family)
MNQFLKWLNRGILGIEVLVALALTVLAGGALFALFLEILSLATGGAVLTPEQFTHIISTILEVFILVELFRIAIAYMKHENVIPTVLEAALVAVARKFVVYEGGPNPWVAVGMSALLLAVAGAWWMLNRANACDIHE